MRYLFLKGLDSRAEDNEGYAPFTQLGTPCHGPSAYRKPTKVRNPVLEPL